MESNNLKFKALGGENEVSIWATSHSERLAAAQILKSEVERIEKKFSRYDSNSIVSQINSAAGGGPIEVDSETADLIDFGALCYKESKGLFDLSSGVLRKAWDFKGAKLPSQKEITQLLELVGWDKVVWKRPYITLKKVGMEIDFGGIGKEYAVDRLVTLAGELKISCALINLAGDVRCLGQRPDGTPWRIGITHPRSQGKLLGHLEIISGAVATSGDYERFIEVEGKRYCHILNPKTGWPVTRFQSVTVVSNSCLIAGTASTMAMLSGSVKDLKKAKMPFVVVLADGQVVKNSAIFLGTTGGAAALEASF